MRNNVAPTRVPGTGELGVALPAVLIFLFLVSILGITGMQRSTLDERMSGNAVSRKAAFQTAEGVLSRGQAVIDNNDCAVPASELSDAAATDATLSNNPANWSNNRNVNVQTLTVSQRGDAQSSQYIIREVQPGGGAAPAAGDSNPSVYADSYNLYRITAHGSGRTDNAGAVIETTYRCRE